MYNKVATASEKVVASISPGRPKRQDVLKFQGYDVQKDYRMPDLRGSRILELRNNTYGHRAWNDSVSGYHDPTEGNPVPPMENWMQKWIGTDQTMGWRHKADLDKRPRPESLPSRSRCDVHNEGKTVMYDINQSYPYREIDCINKVYTAEEAKSLNLPRFPACDTWKVNRYGNTMPTRIRGGIGNHLPSHTEILWLSKQGPEHKRVLNPPSTKGVLQKRVRH